MCGVVWCGVVWCGVVWCGVVLCGAVWHRTLRVKQGTTCKARVYLQTMVVGVG